MWFLEHRRSALTLGGALPVLAARWLLQSTFARVGGQLCRSLLCLLAITLLVPAAAQSKVQLPAIFSDNMVLQRLHPVAVWGTAAAGERVVVQLAGQSVSTAADHSGRWRVVLKELPAGGPYELKAGGTNLLTIHNVLIGDVWLCAGQSNMGITVAQSNNGDKAVARSNNSAIRLFKVGQSIAFAPEADLTGAWAVCSPATVGSFSAVGYYFGSELAHEVGVPIGLIDCSYGGYPIDAWLSRSALEPLSTYAYDLAKWDLVLARYPIKQKDYAEQASQWKSWANTLKRFGLHPSRPPKPPYPPSMLGRPTSIFNAMVAPLIPFSLRGVIWNQGEGDVGKASRYGVLFPALISDWRARWGQAVLPFYFVQLHNYLGRAAQMQRSLIAELRESQQAALSLPHTGMAVAIDLGGTDNSIHYLNKSEVGGRLAAAVLAEEYGHKLASSGPTFLSATVEGATIRIRYQHCDGGLRTRDGQPLRGFAIAGADKRFVWADAVVDRNCVIVSSPRVKNPVAVRYAWADNPDCNLINGALLPAAPFKTDAGSR